MNAGKPIKLAIGMLREVHEALEQLDRRNGGDRGHQFELELAEIDLGDPMRPSVVFAHDHGRDKIGVAGEKHDHDERGHQRQVDDRQIGQEDLFIAHAGKLRQQLIEVQAGLEDQSDKADGESQIKRRQEKPAREQHALERIFDHRSLAAPKASSDSGCIKPGLGAPFSLNVRSRASRALSRSNASARRGSRLNRRAARVRRPRRAFSRDRDRDGREG